MQQIQPTIRTMAWDEAREFGHLNRGRVMDYNCISYRLSVGTTDDLYTFKSGVTLYVLTINRLIDYVGLDAYIGSEKDPIDSIFLQGSAIEECIGNNWRSLSLTTLTTRLINLFA